MGSTWAPERHHPACSDACMRPGAYKPAQSLDSELLLSNDISTIKVQLHRHSQSNMGPQQCRRAVTGCHAVVVQPGGRV